MNETNDALNPGNNRSNNRRGRNNNRSNYRNFRGNGYYNRYPHNSNASYDNSHNGYNNYEERRDYGYQRNNEWFRNNSRYNQRNSFQNRNTDELGWRQRRVDRETDRSEFQNANSLNDYDYDRTERTMGNNQYNHNRRQQNINRQIKNSECRLNNQSKPKTNNKNYSKYNKNKQKSKSSLHDRSCSNSSDSKSTQDIDNNQRDKQLKEITSGKSECLICCDKIKVESAIWHCKQCFNIFHIHCIKKWSKSCLSKDPTWRCPACQMEHDPNHVKIIYECYCRKMREPDFKITQTPHSCGDLCSKPSRVSKRCPHLCTMLCHPGPCPPCEASLIAPCFCSKTTLSVKCSTAETNLSCGETCERLLNCGIHKCAKICHHDDCGACDEDVLQSCHCGKVVDKVITCGSEDVVVSCGGICNKLLACGNHYCQNLCHNGPCKECELLPENLLFCACGQTQLKDLSVKRLLCTDPIPLCNNMCSKPRKHCSHLCHEKCHHGDCKPCQLKSNVRCRCKVTSVNLKCSKIAEDFENNNGVVCSNVCKARKECGIHRCFERCCPARTDLHYCSLICTRKLSCGQHRCEDICHRGPCVACHNVSFDELRCTCGSTVLYPPIQCGQSLPPCNNLCTRPQVCTEHPVQHKCHGDDEECPPCVVLTDKLCAGQHKTIYNIPCFHKNLMCGQKCGKKLPNCQHSCQANCHSNECSDVCTQKCQIPRQDCSHPCNKPCHADQPCVNEDDFTDSPTPCQQKLFITCDCLNRRVETVCWKRLEIKITIRSQMNLNQAYNSDYTFNQTTGELMLCCNEDCAKIARKKQLDEAFSISEETDDSSLLRTNENSSLYSTFIKEFAMSNPEFLKSTDKIFVGMINKIQNENQKKAYHRFDNLNRSKRQFVHELAQQFLLSTQSVDKEPHRHIMVEAVKGYCKIPSVRLLSYMQKNYPNIMFKDNRRPVVRHCPNPLNAIGEESFAEKMKSIKTLPKES